MPRLLKKFHRVVRRNISQLFDRRAHAKLSNLSDSIAAMHKHRESLVKIRESVVAARRAGRAIILESHAVVSDTPEFKRALEAAQASGKLYEKYPRSVTVAWKNLPIVLKEIATQLDMQEGAIDLRRAIMNDARQEKSNGKSGKVRFWLAGTRAWARFERMKKRKEK